MANSAFKSWLLLSSRALAPAPQIFAGAPAKFLRDLTAAEVASLGRAVHAFTELAHKHGRETSKVWPLFDRYLTAI